MQYPVEITGYRVSVKDDSITLILMSGDTRTAFLTFCNRSPQAFVNRGGFLQIYRPTFLATPTIDILRNESPITLHKNGRLTTSNDIGEDDEEIDDDCDG